MNNAIPTSIDAEIALLGAILYKPSLANEIISKLKADDFYSNQNRTVFEAICSLTAQNKDISPITVAGITGDKVTMTDLLQMSEQSLMVTPQAFEIYIGMVRESSIRRQIIAFASRAQLKVREEDNLDDLLSSIETSWFEITKEQSADWEMNSDLVMRHLVTLEDRCVNKGITGVATGFPELDRVTAGWGKGHLVFVGAAPKMGKTSLAMHFALHSGVPTVFFTLEMLPEEILDRQISAVGRIDGQSIKTGNLSEYDWGKVVNTGGQLTKKPIGWVKKTGMNTTEIKAVCRRFQAQHGLGLVIIDQLDKIRERTERGEKKTDSIGRVTGALKSMANDLQVPVICLVQLLDKEVSRRQSPRPTYGDIRDSSCPDQDGDVILYLWRPEFYQQNKPHLKGKAEIIIARQRSGPPASVWVKWEPRYTLFDQLPVEEWLRDEDLRA